MSFAAVSGDASFSAPKVQAGNVNAPLRLSCLGDIQLRPSDVDRFNVASYQWSLRIESGSSADFVTIAETDRIRIDPRTGEGSKTQHFGMLMRV